MASPGAARSAAADDDLEPGSAGTYAAGRAREVTARATMAELELQRQLGAVRDAVEVQDAVRGAGAIFRTGVEGWPAALSARLAALGGNEARIAALLRDECTQLLHRVSAEFARLADAPPTPPAPPGQVELL
jgi:hypothetical protein